MSRVIITARAGQGLERCRRFLADKSETAIRRATQAIEQRFLMLETAPAVGRPFPENPARVARCHSVRRLWLCGRVSTRT
ncbi:MAG TPA: type II toxin-antitoxin system RelE/ParE family toxin [Trinickia sp.]|uniref:type II toxin-antitoxin system RelE/ParE family toxin n=1 Tax=Trinickia sp. TaxID=2571163 RepID=UPI002F3F09FB